MRLFYADQLTAHSKALELDETDSRHISKALRLGVGDQIELTNGRGLVAAATIRSADKKTTTVQLDSFQTIDRSWKTEITLAIAPTKNLDRLEWFTEKATEIGINRIIPILCQNNERQHLKTDRLMRIAISAMKQSQQYWLPDIMELTPLDQLLKAADQSAKWIAHCHERFERVFPSPSPVESVLVLIGPEGDFSPKEIEQSVAAGFNAINLGPNRLRTETAGISALMHCHLLLS